MMQGWVREQWADYEKVAVRLHWRHQLAFPLPEGSPPLVLGGKHRTVHRLSLARGWCVELLRSASPVFVAYTRLAPCYYSRREYTDAPTFLARAADWDAALEARLLAGPFPDLEPHGVPAAGWPTT
jgi:hypothetical protein